MKHIVNPPYARHRRSQLHPFTNPAAHAEVGRRTFLRGERIPEIPVEGSTRIGPFGHGLPCSGHPVPAAVALEAQRICEADALEAHVGSVSPHFLARHCPRRDPLLVREARGIRQSGVTELVEDKDGRRMSDPGTKSGSWVAQAALHQVR